MKIIENLEKPMPHKSGYGLNVGCIDHNNVHRYCRVIPFYAPDAELKTGEESTHNIIGFCITIFTERFLVDCDGQADLAEIEQWIGKYYTAISQYIASNDNLSPKELTEWAQKYTSSNKDYTLQEVLRAINVLEEDIDITVDGFDTIAVVAPIELTESAKKHFQAALALPVRERTVCCDIVNERDCTEVLELAWELLSGLAGYCPTDKFEKWFENGEQL